MRTKDMINLINSLHSRCGLRGTEIRAVCLDVVEYEKANKETKSQLDIFVDIAFNTCSKEAILAFEEQVKQDKLLSSARHKRVLANDNVIEGYFN